MQVESGIINKLQEWCNDNDVNMNEVDFEYAIKVYQKLGHFDFSIENSRLKNKTNSAAQ